MKKVTSIVLGTMLVFGQSRAQIQIQMGTRSPAPLTQSAFICNTSFEPLFRHKPIQSKAAWETQVPAIKSDLQQFIYGTFPKKYPKIVYKKTSQMLAENVIHQQWEITFDDTGSVRIEVLLPNDSTSPKPIFMTQWNHRTWAMLAVRRGYAGVVYAGSDDLDDSKNLNSMYPKATFGTLAKRAWLAGRVVDFLHRQAWVDTSKIALAGHSRNGKQALIAAAFDTRIKAVISSSAGTGGELPWRYAHPFYCNESLQLITKKFPQWFDSGLSKFAGREIELPVDQHLLLGLVAPRHVLVITAKQEAQANNMGAWHCQQTLETIFTWYGARNNLDFWFREGEHATDATHVETMVDWLDAAFFSRPSHIFSKGFQLERNPATRMAENQQGESSWLGKVPPLPIQTRKPQLAQRRKEPHHLAEYMVHPVKNGKGICTIHFGPYHELGHYLYADMFMPGMDDWQPDTVGRKKYPVIVFVHPAAWNTGYRLQAQPLIEKWVQAGFAVLCFDLNGFGTRGDEAEQFNQRFPNWTRLGQMAQDTRDAMKLAKNLEIVDSGRVFLAGMGLGAQVILQGFSASEKTTMALYDPYFAHLGADPAAFHQWFTWFSRFVHSSGINRNFVFEKLRKLAANENRILVLQPENESLKELKSWQSLLKPFQVKQQNCVFRQCDDYEKNIDRFVDQSIQFFSSY